MRGKYHDPFVKAWKRFHTKWKHIEDKAQNENPSKLPASQLYVIMVVGNGGDDLERFDVKDFHAAKSLILQVRFLTSGLHSPLTVSMSQMAAPESDRCY